MTDLAQVVWVLVWRLRNLTKSSIEHLTSSGCTGDTLNILSRVVACVKL